jgi:hypothetical protein
MKPAAHINFKLVIKTGVDRGMSVAGKRDL